MKKSKLTKLAKNVEEILLRELRENNIKYDSTNVEIYNIKSVGVQGDKRTYSYPVEIEIRANGKIIFDYDFLEKLSTRITNQVKDINRVLYRLSGAE